MDLRRKHFSDADSNLLKISKKLKIKSYPLSKKKQNKLH